MNSIPVLLLPLGEQPDMTGAGGKPPGTDDTAVGREAFLVILQQMLLGGALQDPATVPVSIAGGGTTETENPVLCATTAVGGATQTLQQPALHTAPVLSLFTGGTAQPLELLGAGVELPPALQRPAADPGVKSGSNAPVVLQDALFLSGPTAEDLATHAERTTRDAQPGIVESNAEVLESQPSVRDAKPVMSESQPSVRDMKPVMPESQPGVRDVKPVTPEVLPRTHDARVLAAEVQPRLQEATTATPEAAVPLAKGETPEIEPRTQTTGRLAQILPGPAPSAVGFSDDARVNDAGQSTAHPVARRSDAGETIGRPGAIRDFAALPQGLRIVSRAPAPQAGAAASTILVSGKEGDVQPARARGTAPAAMKTEGSGQSGEPVQQLPGRVFQLAPTSLGALGAERSVDAQSIAPGKAGVAGTDAKVEEGSSNAPREAAPETAKPAAIGTSSPQERSPGEGTEQRGQHAHPPVVSVVPKGEVTDIPEVRGNTPAAPTPLPRETAVSVLNQVAKEFALQVRGELSELRIKLEPESLGEVVLHVRMESGKMQAQIDVTQAGVKTVLENSLPQLRLALHERGIDVQRLDVSFGGERLGNALGDGNADRQQRQGSRRNTGAEAVEYHTTGRLLGYNTMEMVM